MPEVLEVIPETNASQVLPADEPDNGLLSLKQVAALRSEVAQHLPRGELLSMQDVFAPS